MAISKHRIVDSASFQSVSADPNQIAGLYFFATLDCLVNLATHVAHDFFDRPQLYTAINAPSKTDPGPLEAVLAALHAREGTDELYLSSTQRKQVYEALFGCKDSVTGSTGSFERLRNELLNASAAFAERVFDTGVDMLRERVRLAHRPFKEYLIGLQGSSVRWSSQALTALNEGTAYRILRDSGVAAVFGIANPPTAGWPFLEDSNADKLVEEISRQLLWHRAAVESIAVGEPYPKGQLITRERISNIQRAASTGAVAIRTVMDFTGPGTDSDLATLITAGYSWGSALMAIEVPPTVEIAPLDPGTTGLVGIGYRGAHVGGTRNS
jgi:hypothetical protein